MRRSWKSLAMLVAIVAACSSTSPVPEHAVSSTTGLSQADAPAESSAASSAAPEIGDDPTDPTATSHLAPWRQVREGPRPTTSGSVPHVQVDAAPIAEFDAELRRRIFSLPGISNEQSDRSLPGARGLVIVDQTSLARRDIIVGSREFGHVHPDGSMHVWVPVGMAQQVHDNGWGELHPWVERDGFWPGVVMVFTPQNAQELEVAIAVVVDAYNFITGANLTPADIP